MLGKLKQKLASIKEKLVGKIKAKQEEKIEEETEAKLERKETLKPQTIAPPEHRHLKEVKRTVKKIFHRKLSESDIDDIIWDLHVALLESDVALPVAQSIVESVKAELIGREIGLRDDPREISQEVLKRAIEKVLTPQTAVNLIDVIERKKNQGEPAVIVFFGINGVGKTTTVAKVAHYLKQRGYRVLLAASDTFRAAGIEQLEEHASRIGVPVIKQRRGADAAAVAYDAILHAKAKGYHVVLVDTSGRMQTDVDLMDEMKKIVRVTKPDLKIFVGDALAGNDAVEQATTFDREVGIDGVILCKMDADARGGAAISISKVTGKPILMLGTGQKYDDLVEFNSKLILDALFGD